MSTVTLRVRRHAMAPEQSRALGADAEVALQAQRLAAASDLAPVVYAEDLQGSWLEMARVEGSHLPDDWWRDERLCGAFVEVMRELWSLPVTGLPRLRPFAQCLLLRDRLASRQPQLAHRYAAALAACAPLDARVSPMTERCVLVHGDLHCANVIIRMTDARWCLLDWEYAHAGHVLEDVAGILVEHAEALRQLELGEGPLTDAVHALLGVGAIDELRAAVTIRRLLNALWMELWQLLEKPTAKLE